MDKTLIPPLIIIMTTKPITKIILKVTNQCNLSCSYCYVYNKKDHSYMDEPEQISESTINALFLCINEYCCRKNIDQFGIIFHGGEPLIVGLDFYEKFVTLARKNIPSTKLTFSLQTNGTLITDEWCSLLKQLGIFVGISIDGDKNACKNRVFKNNKFPAFHSILAGYNIIKKYFTPAVLSVIDTTIDAVEYYNFMKSLSIKELDCLPPDSTYDFLDEKVSGLGKWLCNLFDVWYYDPDPQKPAIRILDTIVHLILGIDDKFGGEMFGTGLNTVIDIRPQGNIEVVDTLKICNKNFQTKTYNVFQNKLDDITSETIFYKFCHSHKNDVLSKTCRNCVVKKICGGGILAHRFSSQNEFLNPTVYCEDIFTLITHIQNCVMDDLPEQFLERLKVTRLTLQDFKQT